MDALGINFGFLLAQLINFGLFAGLAYALAWKPLVAFLDKRSEDIAKGLEDARVASEARANAEAEAKRIVEKARSEAQAIIAEARSSADERAKPIITAAEQEAEAIRQEARARAEEERIAALSNVRGQVVSLAMAAANRLIGESVKVDEKQRERIVTDFFATAATDIKGLSGNLVVTTALPLSDAERSNLEKSLGGKVSEWRVDPSILGGVIVRAGDKVIDGSVRSGLGAMSASLS